MFFPTAEYYNDDFVITPNEKDFCFICLDNENNYCNLIMLNHQQMYICYCQCNGWIHHTCLRQWLDINQTCPLCRRRMIKNTYLQHFLANNQNIYFMNQFVKYLLSCAFYCLILMYYYIIGKTYVYIFDSIFIKLT
jgi:hypothetical protein